MQKTELAKQLSANLALRLPSEVWRTRFAPAPTGFLHLGHVVNAIHVWGIARAFGGHVVLRIEDHDRQRCRADFEDALLHDLDWLGFAPDVGATAEFRAGNSEFRQSDNGVRFETALIALDERQLLYPCICSRKNIEQQARPSTSGELRYPGTCATRHVNPATTTARRVRLETIAQSFDDLRLGPQLQTPSEQCGDFVLRDRLGHFTYQFAVSVDDYEQKIDVIIRGEDLLESTGRQLQLARLMGRTQSPLFLHHDLLRRADGLKLSKSLGDTGIGELRARGMAVEQVIGQAAFESGLIQESVPITQQELPNLFRV